MPSKECVKVRFTDEPSKPQLDEAGHYLKSIVVEGASENIPLCLDKTALSNEAHYTYEGSNAGRKPSDSEPSVVKHKVGRKRRGRSMGHYPFLTWTNRYLKARGQTYAEATRKELERRYRRM